MTVLAGVMDLASASVSGLRLELLVFAFILM